MAIKRHVNFIHLVSEKKKRLQLFIFADRSWYVLRRLQKIDKPFLVDMPTWIIRDNFGCSNNVRGRPECICDNFKRSDNVKECIDDYFYTNKVTGDGEVYACRL